MKHGILYAAAATLLVAACANATGVADPTSPAAMAIPANGPLWRTDGGSIIPMPGSIAADAACLSISVTLERDHSAAPAPKVLGQPFPCRRQSLYVGYLRSMLFIEGLDKNGARLFVATGDNPLHQDLEVPPPPSGGDMSWHSVDTPAAAVTTMISAPITPALARLRWYDVDEHFQPRLMGETTWIGPSRSPS